MKKTPTRFRSQLLRLGFVGLLTVVVLRISYVQRNDTFLAKKENQQWNTEQVITPVRGTIYDAGGDELAFDMPAYDLDLYLPGIQGQGSAVMQKLSDGLGKILHISPQTVLQQLGRTDVTWLRWYPYMVDVALSDKQAIVNLFHELGLDADINPYHTYLRVYPDHTFASEVVGFVDQSGQGQAGTELQYNSYLAGVPGMQSFLRDSMGNPIPFHSVVLKPVQNGDGVYLTIDASIQHYAEEALAKIEKLYTPAHAAIIVADPNTGAILAMATIPDYDPNDYWAYPSNALNTNWAISDPFEPGSTFKLVTLTGALTTHAITLNQTYESGVIYVNGVPIHDWNWWGWGRITYREALIQSSNVGFVRIGQAEGPQTLAHYIHLFGMDQPTGIDLPGEGTSILFDPNNINAVDFATTTFGQGLAVTPIQQIQEVDAIANGGRLLTPYVVQKVVTSDGKVIYNRQPRMVRQVAPSSIFKTITNVMIQDVNDDPFLKAYIPGYEVAGKTGTANIPKPGGGYYQNRYNLSFIGFAPARHPALAIYVTVNEPHHAIQYGNDVSSPAAKFILKQSLNYLRIPPSTGDQSSPWKLTSTTPYKTVPNVQGLSVAKARHLLATAGFSVTAIDASGVVTRQWPEPGTTEATGAEVVIASVDTASLSGHARMPNLKGMSMAQAINVCSLLGLQLQANGDGYAVSQSIAPGSQVPLGATVNVQFRPQVTGY